MEADSPLVPCSLTHDSKDINNSYVACEINSVDSPYSETDAPRLMLLYDSLYNLNNSPQLFRAISKTDRMSVTPTFTILVEVCCPHAVSQMSNFS